MKEDDITPLLWVMAGIYLLSKIRWQWYPPVAQTMERGGATLYEKTHGGDSSHSEHLPSRTKLTKAKIVDIARRVGFPDPNMAAAIAMAESGGYSDAKGDSGVSIGLWQINTRAHPEYGPELLLNPEYNAQAALAISRRGTKWTPWSVYKSGRYKRYL